MKASSSGHNLDAGRVTWQPQLPETRAAFESEQKYAAARDSLMQADAAARFAGTLTMTQEEALARQYFAELQTRELATFQAQGTSPFVQPFFLAKDTIEKSPIFALLKKLPKGGALHVHSLSSGSARWLVDVASYRPECHVYWPEDGRVQPGQQLGQLAFYKPGTAPRGFRAANDVRKSCSDFDACLWQLLTMGPADDSSGDPWQKFGACVGRLGGALNFEPVFVEYSTQAFETLIADGVDYVELRTGVGQLFDFDNHRWSGERFIDKFWEIRNVVRQKHPDFDFKLIINDWRGAANKDVWASVQNVAALRSKYPEFVVGYDLVGKEHAGKNTSAFLDVWLSLPMVCAKYNIDLPLYLHAGETTRADDENLYDAYLLGARRIGHGLNLAMFPELERRFLQRPVPLEICPISNQILGFVRDLRAHPACGYVRRGIPCVISSDDPGIFGYDGLSYDYWQAFMAWELDLMDLKQFALNSIRFSAMPPASQAEASKRWQEKWHAFIHFVNEQRLAETNAQGLVK